MSKAFKNKTRERFFEIRDKLDLMPEAREESLKALRRAVVIHSCAIDMDPVGPAFLQLAPDRIPDRRWDRISSDYQNAMLETQMMLQVVERLEETAVTKHSLTIPFILQLHRTVFEKTQYSTAGKFRATRDLTSETGHELPHQTKLPEIMDHHLSWLMHRLSIFSDATPDNFLEMFHIAAEGMYRFADTVPFEIGNGRFTRLVGAYILLFTGLFHNVIRFEDRAEYLEAIRNSAIDDLTSLVDFLIRSFAGSLDCLDGFVQLAERQHQQTLNRNYS